MFLWFLCNLTSNFTLEFNFRNQSNLRSKPNYFFSIHRIRIIMIHIWYMYIGVASFPGLPRVQFLIACSMQKLSQKAWWILPRDSRQGRNILSRLICMAVLQRWLILCFVLAMKTRQAPTENNIKRTKNIWARRHSSEGLPNDQGSR